MVGWLTKSRYAQDKTNLSESAKELEPEGLFHHIKFHGLTHSSKHEEVIRSLRSMPEVGT